MCGIFCCFGFLTCIGCRNRVCRVLVFFPPPPGYSFDINTQTFSLIGPDGKPCTPIRSDNLGVFFIPTKKGQHIAAFFARVLNPRFTILFSHGNATDIGYMRDHLLDFATQMRVNIFAYDYAGYGESTGLPSTERIAKDIQAAFKYLVEDLNISPSSIILYGQSLGTSPTLQLASENRSIAGVILHSPLMSGLRVMRPVKKTHWFDILNNIDVICDVHAPIYIIHGCDDKEVPIHHGTTLYEKSKKKYEPWFVEGAGHNDIEIEQRNKFFEKMDSFLSFLETTGVNVKDVVISTEEVA